MRHTPRLKIRRAFTESTRCSTLQGDARYYSWILEVRRLEEACLNSFTVARTFLAYSREPYFHREARVTSTSVIILDTFSIVFADRFSSDLRRVRVRKAFIEKHKCSMRRAYARFNAEASTSSRCNSCPTYE